MRKSKNRPLSVTSQLVHHRDSHARNPPPGAAARKLTQPSDLLCQLRRVTMTKKLRTSQRRLLRVRLRLMERTLPLLSLRSVLLWARCVRDLYRHNPLVYDVRERRFRPMNEATDHFYYSSEQMNSIFLSPCGVLTHQVAPFSNCLMSNADGSSGPHEAPQHKFRSLIGMSAPAHQNDYSEQHLPKRKEGLFSQFFGSNALNPVQKAEVIHPCVIVSRSFHQCLDEHNNIYDFCRPKLNMFEACLREYRM